MLLVLDVLIIDDVGENAARAKATRENLQVAPLKVPRKVGHERIRMFRKDGHHAHMALRLGMALEAIRITALLVAHLAEEAQL